MACLVATFLFTPALHSKEPSENPEASRLVKEYSGLEMQLSKDIQNENEARQALEQAQRALESARRLNDKQAGAIADEAISIAQDALSNAQAQRARREGRMAEISGLLGWKSKAGKIALGGIIKGDVYRKTNLGWARLNSRTPLFEGDELRTGAKGFLDIELDSGGRVALDENTTLVFAEFGKDRSIFDLISGRLHSLVECRKTTGHPCRQQTYRTAIAILGVRGTEFTMRSLPNGDTDIAVFEGVVDVTGKKSNKTVKVNAGEEVTIKEDGAIRGSSSVDLKSLPRWWEVQP